MDITKFKKLLMDDFLAASPYFGQDMDHCRYSIQHAKKPSEVQIYYCASPRQQYSIDLLGEKPPGLVLECQQFPLPQSLAGFHGVSLGQCHKLDGSNAKVVKASNIKSFQANVYGLEGCCVGNHFDNAQLAHLPSSLETLILRGCVRLQMPTKFPANLAGLQSLELRGATWKAGNLSNCLPSGLTTLEVGLDCGVEDSLNYKFTSFSLSGLPPSLCRLVVDLGRGMALVGASECPQLTSLTVEDGSDLPAVLPPRLTQLSVATAVAFLPPGLPATLTHLTLALARPGRKKEGEHSDPPFSLAALAASCPALEQLSLHLSREFRYGPDKDLPPSLPALEGDLAGPASLQEVRCNDADMLAALRALPHGRVAFSALAAEEHDFDY